MCKRYHFSLLCILFPQKDEKDLGLLSAAADMKDSTHCLLHFGSMWQGREQLGAMLFSSIAHR
jgi:hypothetical protein